MKKKKENYTLFGCTVSRWAVNTFLAALIVIALWATTLILLWHDDKKGIGDTGKFGDMFGAVNALFSGLAFLGLIITIRQQKRQLDSQREDIFETKEDSRSQNFQNVFFHLLRTQREIIDELHVNLFFTQDSTERFRPADGRRLFRAVKKELRRIFDALELKSYLEYNVPKIEYDRMNMHPTNEEEAYTLAEFDKGVAKAYTLHYYNITKEDFEKFKKLQSWEIMEKIKFVYDHFYKKQGYGIGHYFKHFQNLLLFIEKSENSRINNLGQNPNAEDVQRITEEFKNYIEFLKAQIDVPEMVTLFYSSHSNPDLRKLLIKFKVFNNLRVEDLIQINHNVNNEYGLI